MRDGTFHEPLTVVLTDDDPQTLRPYQQTAYDRTRAAYRAGKRAILLVAPTGAGKTTIGAHFVRRAADKGHPVVWVAHREELLDQARERLLAEGIPRVGIIANDRATMNAPVQVASLPTLVARAHRGLPPARVLVFDEAHHGPAETYLAIARAFQAQGAAILGLTATPERGDGRALGVADGGIFDEMVVVSSVRELQALGFLVPCVTYAPASFTKELSQDPVAAYLSRTPGERAFVFCGGRAPVLHAEKTAAAFLAAGVQAATIHADTPWILRRARIEAFKTQSPAALLEAGTMERPPLVLVNVYTLTEGVDVPEASCCILARGCGHAGMLLQMVGRVLRTAPGKTKATLIDLRGVVHRLGLPEADRTWSLEGKAISLTREERERKRKLKQCPACDGMVATWSTDRDGWRTCPLCRERVAGPELPQVAPRALHAMGTAATPATREKVLATLARSCAKKGYRHGWIGHAYKTRFGEFPPYGATQRALDEAIANQGGPVERKTREPVLAVEEDPDAAFQAYVAEALRCG
jgi:superfamily II DNA or RNA helicase